MDKSYINKLHRIAEFQKKCAWTYYRYAQGSELFKDELLNLAKQATDNCRETRESIRQLLKGGEDRLLSYKLAQTPDGENPWD